MPELNEGGVERGTVDLNCELIKLGIDSIVISNGGKLSEQIEKDGGKHIKFDVCSKNVLTVPFRILGLKKLIKELNPNILHVRSRVPAWLVFLANKSLGIKVVSTVHGFNSVGFYSSIMTKANAVICVSNSIKEYIQKNYQTSNDIISVIPRGVDLIQFNPENLDNEFVADFNKQYNLKNKFVISNIGRVTQLKDYETFIKAVSIIKEQKPNVVGLIVGGVRDDKQEYFESLKKLVEELKLNDNIVFTGNQSKIAEIYSLSDVMVSSSKKPESFGRAVAEALALNTPVVATNHGGVKDIIVENENGFFFEIGDEKELSRKIMESLKLSFDGYNYVSNNFSLGNMVDKTLEVYKRVISE